MSNNLAFILLFLFDVLVIQAFNYPTIFQVQLKANDCTTGVIGWLIVCMIQLPNPFQYLSTARHR